MRWKRIPFWLLALVIVWFVVLGMPSAGADDYGNFQNSLSGGHFGPVELQPIQDHFSSASSSLVDAATHLFVLLITLDIFWMSAQFLLTRDNLGEFIAQVFLKAVTFTFIYGVLILNGQAITSTIIQSFIKAGNSTTPLAPDPALLMTEGILASLPAFAAGLIADAIPDEVLGTGDPELFQALGEFCMWGGAFVLLAYVAMAGELVLVCTEAYIVTSLGILVTGFYGSRWTQQYAEKYFGYAINVGVKLFVTYAVLGFIQDQVFPATLVLLVGVPPENFVVYGLANCMVAVVAYSVPQFAAALVSGSSAASSDKLVHGMQQAVSSGMKLASKQISSESRMEKKASETATAERRADAQERANVATAAFFSGDRQTASFDAPNGVGAASGANGTNGASGADRSGITIGIRGASGQAGATGTNGASSTGGTTNPTAWQSGVSPGSASTAATSNGPPAAIATTNAASDPFAAKVLGSKAGSTSSPQGSGTPLGGGTAATGTVVGGGTAATGTGLGGAAGSGTGGNPALGDGSLQRQADMVTASAADTALTSASPVGPPNTVLSQRSDSPALSGSTGTGAGGGTAADPPAGRSLGSSQGSSGSTPSDQALKLGAVPQTPLGVAADLSGSGAQSGSGSLFGGGGGGDGAGTASTIAKLGAEQQKTAHDLADLKNLLPKASQHTPDSATQPSRPIDAP